MERIVNEAYMRAYMDGYSAALEKHKEEKNKPYIDLEGIVERYGGIGMGKARDIIRAVRTVCNGGKLDSCSKILVSELEYWESIVDKQYKSRL